MSNKLTFRTLLPHEIDVRVARSNKNGSVSVLLYKDARVDQNILDETVGPMNWQRSHSRDNANCTVSIWDEDKNIWVSKEDTGTESNTEKEKGLASDSFKRACFNWGIGRELYSAPKNIVINPIDNGEDMKYITLKVSEIDYNENREITKLVIKDFRNRVRYTFPRGYQPVADRTQAGEPEPTPAVQSLLDKAKADINKATTIEAIDAIMYANKPLWTDSDFKTAIQKRRAELTA